MSISCTSATDLVVEAGGPIDLPLEPFPPDVIEPFRQARGDSQPADSAATQPPAPPRS